MTDYLILESRTPARESAAAELASALARAGKTVTLFLVQNGVLAAREGAVAPAVDGAASAGVEVVADDFSLRERGIADTRLRADVLPAPLARVVDAMCSGSKVIWH